MQIREIHIGRDKRCDIVLGAECVFASSLHASMYMDGSQLMFRDRSRNGSMVNNFRIHNRAVPVNYGDYIMIASKYPLSWNQICFYFPNINNTNQQNQSYSYQQQHPSISNVPPENNSIGTPELGWNWGAFSLYPLWGFWNGCWWGILISIFWGWSILPNILFGAMGSKWAWTNKTWNSAEEFNNMQKAWKPWGIAIFVLWIISIFFLIIFWSTFVSSFYSPRFYVGY